MTSTVYEWIGLGVGTLAVLVASSALIQEVHGGPDFGSVGFDLVFGIFWAGVAVSCGYSLLHSRRREVSGGCLTIAAVAGAMVLLTGGLLAVLSIDGEEPPNRLMVGVMLSIGAVVFLPSILVMWHRRDQSADAHNVRLWQGLVAGGLVAALGGFMLFATNAAPYDVGSGGRVSIFIVIAIGAVAAATCAVLLWRGRGALARPDASR